MSRPSLIASAVAAIFVRSAGLRNETHVTSWPSSTRLVDAASAARMVQASWMPSGGSSGLCGSSEMRWSHIHTE